MTVAESPSPHLDGETFHRLARLLEFCGGNVVEDVNGVWSIHLSPLLHRRLTKSSPNVKAVTRLEDLSNTSLFHLIRTLEDVASE